MSSLSYKNRCYRVKFMDKKIDEKIKKGYILANMWFEVLAITKDAAEKSLKEHIKKLGEFRDCEILKTSFKKSKKVKITKKREGYSKVAKVTLLAKSIESLIFVTILFGPSAVEILKPEKFEFSLATVQAIVNTFADLVHRFAALKGGIIIPAVYGKSK